MCVCSFCVCVCHAHGYCAANCQPPPRSKVATSTRKRSLPVLTWSPERGSLAFECLGHCFSHRKALFFSFRRVGCMCGWVVFLGTPPKQKWRVSSWLPLTLEKTTMGGSLGHPPHGQPQRKGGRTNSKRRQCQNQVPFCWAKVRTFRGLRCGQRLSKKRVRKSRSLFLCVFLRQRLVLGVRCLNFV